MLLYPACSDQCILFIWPKYRSTFLVTWQRTTSCYLSACRCLVHIYKVSPSSPMFLLFPQLYTDSVTA